MGDPSLVKMTGGDTVPSKVVIILSTNSRHSLLEARQLVFEVLHGMVQDIEFRSLLANHLSEVISLKPRLG